MHVFSKGNARDHEVTRFESTPSPKADTQSIRQLTQPRNHASSTTCSTNKAKAEANTATIVAEEARNRWLDHGQDRRPNDVKVFAGTSKRRRKEGCSRIALCLLETLNIAGRISAASTRSSFALLDFPRPRFMRNECETPLSTVVVVSRGDYRSFVLHGCTWITSVLLLTLRLVDFLEAFARGKMLITKYTTILLQSTNQHILRWVEGTLGFFLEGGMMFLRFMVLR